MITFLMSTVGRYLVGGALIAALSGFGWLYVSHLQNENKSMKIEISDLQQMVADRDATIDFLKKAAKIDAETNRLKDEIKEAVKSGDSGRINELYRVFRDKAGAASGRPAGADPGNAGVKPGRN